MQSTLPVFPALAVEELPRANQAVVLCWNTSTVSDHCAYKIARFVGADTRLTCLSARVLNASASLRNLVSESSCVIVDAETLAQAVDAMQTGAEGLNKLMDLAGSVFIFGFQPTERHNAILRTLSEGTLLCVQHLTDGTAEFRVTHNVHNWCGQFSGLSFGGVDQSRENWFLQSPDRPENEVLIRIGDKPFFVRTGKGSSQRFFLATRELADLDEPVQRDYRPLNWFSRLAPLMMFLRGVLGNRVWLNDHPQACFIIDDPLLQERYGFLQYEELLQVMRRLRSAATVAFIPFNYRKSSTKAAALVSSKDAPLSLCVHGCDHTWGEFEDTNVGSLREKSKLARRRMQVHQRLYGVPFDDVMIFPQGLFSAEAITALNASGYLAAVNTDLFPSNAPKTLPLRELIDVAVTAFDNFPLFGRRYPNSVAEFAFDLFMGRPAFVVEHHKYFREGYAAFESFVRQLKSIEDRLEWTNLGTACSRASVTRMAENGEMHVRFYTNRFSLTNAREKPQDYVLFRRHEPDGRFPLVKIDGKGGTHEHVEQQETYLKIYVSLQAGQTIKVTLLPAIQQPICAPGRGNAVQNALVRIRRFLSEFRDNYLHAYPLLTRRLLRTVKLWVVPPEVWQHKSDETAGKRAYTLGSLNASPLNEGDTETPAIAELPSYVLITPARNEAAFIEKTIRSVIAQTVLPLKWVIMDDGSTDGTDEIVRQFVANHPFIELVILPKREQRNFLGKVGAFNAGHARLTGLNYEVIGNLDADVSFDQDYFSFLLRKLAGDPNLGLVGTPYTDPLNQPYDYRFVSREHVTGPCQLFRRECFEAIGGYTPVKLGAIDRIADIAARMKGWKTRTFTEKMYWHHRHTGMAQESLVMSMFRDGGKDYSVGSSPVWELFRTAYQMTKKPLFVGGLMLAFGYFWSLIRRVERPVSREFVEFCRQEQMKRLRALLKFRTRLVAK